MVDSASPMSDVSDLSDRLDSLSGEWKKLKGKVDDRKGKLKDVQRLAEKFYENADILKAWLVMHEEKLGSFEPVHLEEDLVNKQLKESQGLKMEIVRKSRDHDALNKEGQDLMKHSERNQDTVHDILDDVNSRWNTMLEGVTDRVQCLEDTSQRLTEFADALKDVNALIKKNEDKLKSHEELGSAAMDNRHVDKIKMLQDEVQSMEYQVDYVKDQANSLLQNAKPGAETKKIEDRLEDMTIRYRNLLDHVNNLSTEIQSGVDKSADLQVCFIVITLVELDTDLLFWLSRINILKYHAVFHYTSRQCICIHVMVRLINKYVFSFQSDLRIVGSQLAELEDDLDHKAPVSRDVDTIDNQLHDMQIFKDKLEEKKDLLTQLSDKGQDLENHGYISDNDPLKGQVSVIWAASHC